MSELPTTTSTLSEAASKELLGAHGVSFPPEQVVSTPADAARAATEVGYPVVAKLCGDRIAHKTERGLVRLGLADADAAVRAAEELLAAARPDDGEVAVLVGAMVRGNRELIAGLSRDPQFGPTVMIGIGGVIAEAVGDVSVRLVPITELDAHEMIDDLAMSELLGPFRGEPPVDRAALAEVLLALSRAAEAHPEIVSADLNPLIIVDGKPIAVDALVELDANR